MPGVTGGPATAPSSLTVRRAFLLAVCQLTYARIQGKSSMVSRFQNSSLMEKNVAYQPLLFYSGGALRGQAEPFPGCEA